MIKSWDAYFLSGLFQLASAVIFVVIIIILNRKWEAIKFFMFMHFNILPNDDGPENLDEMEFDAFITYRSVNVSFIALEE